MKFIRIRWLFLILVLLIMNSLGFLLDSGSADASSLVFVATYRASGGRGIYSYAFDRDSGRLSAFKLAAESENPGFLALNPSRRFLYAANEISSFQGKPTGAVSAFSIDAATGKLSPLNQVSARDQAPAFLAVDRTGKYVLVCNYPKGSMAVFPILKDGSLGKSTAFVQHTGSGPNAERQEGAHVHAVALSPDNRFALVADLGIDQVLVYPFDATKGTLGQPQVFKFKPGSGPRHLLFSPDGKFVYVIDELTSAITVFSYDTRTGSLAELQTVSTLSQGFTGVSTASEIAMHPSGKFLYGSNRGEDSIAVFAVDSVKGVLTPIQNIPSGGKVPRSFAIDPSGTWLLAANQESNSIASFRINPKTGRLASTGQVVELASPVCIVFLAAACAGAEYFCSH